MSAEGEALARRFFDEMCTGRRLEIADEILAPDHEYLDNQAPPTPTGPAGMAQTVSVYQDTLDGVWTIREIYDVGDRVIVHWTGTGTHKEELMGVPPTGRDISVEAISVLRIKNGKISENRTVWEALALLQQIGGVPAPA